VARWLCDRVGQTGSVVALDMETRFLVGEQHPALQVWQEDIRFAALPAAAFDLIHARYFFLHLPDYADVFARVLQSLKPGGWILVEDPDFSMQASVTPPCPATERVFASILKLYDAMRVDWSMGRRLPELFGRCGLRAVRATTDLPLVPGGGPVATVMRLSVQHIADKLVGTGVAARQDIDDFLRHTADPQRWMYHYATVAVSGQRPG
jgi:hypothetical protein